MQQYIQTLQYYIRSFMTNWEIKATLSGLLMILTSYIGGRDTMLNSAFIIYIMDMIIGVSLAVYRGKFDLNRFYNGLGKVFFFSILLIGANQGDIILSSMTTYDSEGLLSLRDWCVLYFGLHELISLVNKLGTIPGFPIPTGLLDRIKKYKNDLDK